MEDLKRAVSVLEEEHCTCVLCKGKVIYASSARGVKPLLEWIGNKTDLSGFSAADKIVGKASALLFTKVGVSAVYAPVMSEAAVAVFHKNKIAAHCDEVVPLIINRRGTGPCPMEDALEGIDDPDRAYEIILATLKKMESKQG